MHRRYRQGPSGGAGAGQKFVLETREKKMSPHPQRGEDENASENGRKHLCSYRSVVDYISLPTEVLGHLNQ